MKKMISKIGAVLLAAVAASSCLTSNAFAELVLPSMKNVELSTYTGWARDEQWSKLYYENGSLQSGPKVIDGTEYVLNIRTYSEKIDLSNYTGWVLDEKQFQRYYFVKGVMQTQSRIIDGKRYAFLENGISTGLYSGWTESAKGQRYWNNGVLQKDKWILSTDGKYYYAGEKGYMTVGWSDVTRIGGAYSYFDEKGVWDGKVYWSKSNPDATRENMLNETVRIKIKPIETVFGSDIKWSKKEKQYLETNSSYELQIPLAVAETFKVGDTILVHPKVTRGEKKNGAYEYYLTISGWQPLVYAGSGTYPYYEIADFNENGTLDEYEYISAFEQRLELFNGLLLIQDGKLKLDRMFQVLGLSWEEIKGNEEFIRYFEDVHNGIWCWSGVTTYGLFGGYNRMDDETGEYIYRDGMSEKELLDLMKRLSPESKAKREAGEQEEGDYDYYDWFTWASNPGFWLKAEIAEIPSVS